MSFTMRGRAKWTRSTQSSRKTLIRRIKLAGWETKMRWISNCKSSSDALNMIWKETLSLINTKKMLLIPLTTCVLLQRKISGIFMIRRRHITTCTCTNTKVWVKFCKESINIFNLCQRLCLFRMGSIFIIGMSLTKQIGLHFIGTL